MLTEIQFTPAPRGMQGQRPELHVVQGDLEALFADAQKQLLAVCKPRRSVPRVFSLVGLGFLVVMLFGR